MNFYIAITIFIFFVVWFLVSIKKAWEIGLIISMVLGVVWFMVGVVLAPAEASYTQTKITLTVDTIECTSRMCEVDVGRRLITVEDAYRYNMLKNGDYTELVLVTDYNWWENVVNEELIVK